MTLATDVFRAKCSRYKLISCITVIYNVVIHQLQGKKEL